MKVRYNKKLSYMGMVDHQEEVESLEPQLMERLNAGVACFCYLKADATRRIAYGTLRADIITKMEGPRPTDTAKPTKTPAPGNVVYFDLEAMGFRTFKVDKLVSLVI